MNCTKLCPDTKLEGSSSTVGQFWSWAYSDILSNRNRSIFAEFLVGTALGVTDSPRIEWDSIDLRYKGKRIEVKSASYIQSWKQKGLSRIDYDIASKKYWDAVTNTYANEPSRASDCYVFCLYTNKDKENANVLNIRDWQFFVISTRKIETDFGVQKRLSLSKIQSISKGVDFENLKERIDKVLFTES